MKKRTLLLIIPALIVFASGAAAKTVYTIKKGDNLYDIARKFNVSVKDLEGANRVNAKTLKPGKKIIVPGESRSSKMAKKQSGRADETTDASDASALQEKQEQVRTLASHRLAGPDASDKETALPAKAVPAETGRHHVVKKGDTLKAIAKKYNISVSDVRGINGLRSVKLKTGQKLLVKLSGPRTYTVRKRDNLWQIAKRFDMDADDLMEINELSSPDLKVGQKLYLEEKPENVNVDQKYIVMAKNIEDELKNMPESPEFADRTAQDRLVTFAKKLLNIPYKFGGNTILGIDCSGYVKKVYGFMGVNLPRTAREQFKEGEEIEKEDLSVGDLVFFRTYASFPSHVGIYLGNNLFIHASSKGKKVTIDNLQTPYYLKRFIGGKRLISASEEQDKAAADPAS